MLEALPAPSLAFEPARDYGVSKLAQQNNINANMLCELRTGLFEPVAPALLLVLVKPAMTRSPSLPSAEPSSMIEIIIGDAIVRLHTGIDAALLQLVLQSLRP